MTRLSISSGSFVNPNTQSHTTFTMAGKPPTEEGLMKPSRREDLKTAPDQSGQARGVRALGTVTCKPRGIHK